MWPTGGIWSNVGYPVCARIGVFVEPIYFPYPEIFTVMWEITLLVGWHVRSGFTHEGLQTVCFIFVETRDSLIPFVHVNSFSLNNNTSNDIFGYTIWGMSWDLKVTLTLLFCGVRGGHIQWGYLRSRVDGIWRGSPSGLHFWDVLPKLVHPWLV